jgi:hypothetical protein
MIGSAYVFRPTAFVAVTIESMSVALTLTAVKLPPKDTLWLSASRCLTFFLSRF